MIKVKGGILDKQSNRVKVGDTIMYITMRHGDMVFNYAEILEFIEIKRKYNHFTQWAIRVQKLNTDLKYSRVTLRNPVFFKCGVTLEIPTDTQIKGM